MKIKNLRKKLRSVISVGVIGLVLMTNAAPVAATTTYEKTNVNSNVPMKPKYRNVMYYDDYSIYQGSGKYYSTSIPGENLTHLIFSYLDLDKDGNLIAVDNDALFMESSSAAYGEINSGTINELKVLKEDNPNLKTGFSVGGWYKSRDFVDVSADSERRKVFAKDVAEFLNYSTMDFVDISWQYPTVVRESENWDSTNIEGCQGTPEDKENFVLLLREVRNELDKLEVKNGKDYEISVSIPATIDIAKDAIDVKGIFDIVDFANVLAYNMRDGVENNSGHQSALYANPNDPYKDSKLSIDECIKYYISEGAKSDKLVIGVPYFTRGWQETLNDGTDENSPGLFGTCLKSSKDFNFKETVWAKSESGYRVEGKWAYRSIDKLKVQYPGLVEYWDDYAKAPYLYNKDTGAFFSYDNERSITEKCNYVKENNLGGMMASTAAYDKETDSNSKVRDELISITKKALYGDEKLPSFEMKYNNSDVDVNIELEDVKYPQYGEPSKNIKLTITNKASVASTNKLLKTVEEMDKTLINTKIYIKADNLNIVKGAYPIQEVIKEDGYFVVDLSKDYSTRFIKPGNSVTLTLQTKENITDIKGIEEVLLTERIYDTSKESRKELIYIGDTDVLDLSKVAVKYNIKKDEDGFDSKYDLNKDGIIDLYDLVTVAKKINQ